MVDNISKILVTGGAGFVGSNLCNTLASQGHEVTVVDNLKNGSKDNLVESITLIEEDVVEYDLASNLDFSADFVYHLVCTGLQESMMYPKLDLDVNGKSILNSLNYAKESGASLIYTGSGAVHGIVEREDLPLHEGSKTQPSNFYGATKLLAEYYCKIYSLEHNVPTMICRLWNVYGYPQRINYEIGWIPVVTAFLTLKEPSIFGDGNQTRDFTYVKDVVDGLILGMKKLNNDPFPTETVNLCGGSETSIKELYEKCSKIVGREIPSKFEPPLPGDVPFLLATHSKAHEILDWKPRTMDEALDDYYNELKKNKEL